MIMNSDGNQDSHTSDSACELLSSSRPASVDDVDRQQHDSPSQGDAVAHSRSMPIDTSSNTYTNQDVQELPRPVKIFATLLCSIICLFAIWLVLGKMAQLLENRDVHHGGRGKVPIYIVGLGAVFFLATFIWLLVAWIWDVRLTGIVCHHEQDGDPVRSASMRIIATILMKMIISVVILLLWAVAFGFAVSYVMMALTFGNTKDLTHIAIVVAGSLLMLGLTPIAYETLKRIWKWQLIHRVNGVVSEMEGNDISSALLGDEEDV